MPPALLSVLVRLLRRDGAAQEGDDPGDGALLARFVADRDDSAFAELVRRHGPMVLGVCRRVAGDAHAAEDAFQATFLVLARRAGAIRKQASVGSWLFGVARRIAGRAKAQAAARRERERRAADMRAGEPLDDATWQELRTVLDEEVGRLPEKYRAAVVLCHLEGKSYDQAARELGCPKSSLASRLTKARDLLRGRLARRGLALSAGALAAALTERAAATPVPALLTATAVRAARSVATGHALAEGCLSAQAVALADEALRFGVGFRGKRGLLLVMLGLAVGAALAGYAAWVGQPPGAGDPGKNGAVAGPAVDVHGDPLPAGAVARLGRDRWLHDTVAHFAAFLPDGNVVTVNDDLTVRVWAFPSGKELRRFDLPGDTPASGGNVGANTGAVTDDGRIIATWLPQNWPAVYLHDLATGKRLQRLEVMKPVDRMTFAPDGSHLAVVTTDGAVRIWDWARAKEIWHRTDSPFSPYPRPVYAPDGTSIATAFVVRPALKPGEKFEFDLDPAPGVVQFRDPATGAELRTFPVGRMTDILSLTFAPDAKKLALVARESVERDSVVLVEAATGKHVGKLVVPDRHAVSCRSGVPFAVFNKDGTRVYLSSHGRGLVEWDVASGELRREMPCTATEINPSLSPDGRSMVLAGYGPAFRDLGGRDITALEYRTPPLVAVQFTPGGKRLLTLSASLQGLGSDHTVRRFDVATGKDLGAVSLPPRLTPRALSPDGKVLACIQGDGQTSEAQAVLFDTATGKEMGQVPCSTYSRLRFSPDGNLLAIGQCLPRHGREVSKFNPHVELYEIPAVKLRHRFDMEERDGDHFPETMSWSYWWRTLIFAADGKTLAGRIDSRHLELWDTTTGRPIRSLALPPCSKLVYRPDLFQGMDGAALAPDGRSVVQDLDDGTAVLIDVATAQPGRIFGTKVAPKDVPLTFPYLNPDEFKAGSCFAFSPDGRLLARSGWDRTVHVYDVATGQELAAFRGHAEAVTALAFAPDGRTLASASKDSTALIWDVSQLAPPAPGN